MSATKDRQTFIGGSDIAGIMGMSRWSTPLKVWGLKTGMLPEKDLSDVEAVELGIELEDKVAEIFVKRIKKEKNVDIKLRRDSRDFTHPKYPYLKAHIDRWVVGTDALFEAKTTNAYALKDWDGESVPSEYILQCQWYCGIVGKSFAYIAVLIGGQKFRWRMIEFDKELFDKMVETAVDFWENFVQKKVAPMTMPDDNEETIDLLFPKSGENILKIEGKPAEILNRLVEERQGGVEQKKIVEKELDGIDAQIKILIGENEALETGVYRASWKSQTKAYADQDKLKEDGLWEKYKKETSFRVIRTTKLTKEKK